MRKRVCCFTDHRCIPQDELEWVEKGWKATITELYSRGVVHCDKEW